MEGRLLRLMTVLLLGGTLATCRRARSNVPCGFAMCGTMRLRGGATRSTLRDTLRLRGGKLNPLMYPWLNPSATVGI